LNVNQTCWELAKVGHGMAKGTVVKVLRSLEVAKDSLFLFKAGDTRS
jgi:hypothetical protein